MDIQDKKDYLFLKRTPTVTYAGGPIPENIKQCYVQQQLPVRKQSLAAHVIHSKKKIMTRPIRHSSIQQAQVNTPNPLLFNSNNKSTPSFNLSVDSLVEEIEEEEEDDEFNFKDRPPSSIIVIKPMDPQEEEIVVHSEPFLSPIPQRIPTPNTSNINNHNGSSNNNNNNNWRKGSKGENSIPHILLSESRLSIDTDLSEMMSPQEEASYPSLFLTKMQLKREEQQKSIDAYRSPPIYAALLSQAANEFYKRITLSNLTKDGIEYHDVFTGKEAVDRLLSILKLNNDNTSRLEAIEFGSALRNQSFFHHVNYEPIFVDSQDEVYAFKHFNDVEDSPTTPHAGTIHGDNMLPNGIYTNLTDCYSPTCTNDNLCYSWSCLRKKSLKQSQISQLKEEDTRLWSQSVPENVVEATLPEERKRQECIYELIYTEQDFVRDLQYVHDFWVDPLLAKDIVEYSEDFVNAVFFNIADVRHVNTELARALEARQAEKYLVSSIGDVMLEHVCNFQPFVDYGAHQVIGKFHFELEKKKNPLFARFVEETERKPESRRLELNGYLTKPTTRLGRYNLLLREILKRTPDDNPDKEIIPQIMDIITKYLEQVNIEAGKCENLFNLQQIGERLEFRSPSDYVDLKLEKPGRQLLMKGRMKRKGNSSSEASDLQVFLFDHYLVFAKIKYEDHLEYYRTYRRPIPLELLSINANSNSTNNRQKRASSILPYSRSTTLNNIAPRPSTSEKVTSPITRSNPIPNPLPPPNASPNPGTATAKTSNNSLSISFTHHGRKGSSQQITLYTTASSIQQIWVKKILDQKYLLATRKNIFTVTPLIKDFFITSNRVNNTLTMDDGRVLVGADGGVYITTTTNEAEKKSSSVTRIIHTEKVSQIETMQDSQLLVLADKTLWTFPLEVLSQSITQQRGRPVSQNTTFFHVGECLNKTLVCVVKTNTLSPTTIRVMEPVMMDENKKTKSMFSLKRLVRGGPVGLKPFKDLYLPSQALSINLLKSKMCISSPQEIGVVDMKNFGVQALLDPEDEQLSFVFNRTDVQPVTIYRIQFAEYLVCYNEFAFFVDQRGRFIRSSPRIDWEGAPDSFALSYPYILAFEPDFIEVRNVHTGELEQVIRGKNIRCTSTNTHNSTLHVAMDDPSNEGYQLVFQLDRISKFDDTLLKSY